VNSQTSTAESHPRRQRNPRWNSAARAETGRRDFIACRDSAVNLALFPRNSGARMGRRTYSALQARLRDEWFGIVETPDVWIDRGPMNDGESQSIRVENAATGMMGVAKPGPGKAAEEGHYRAAHEKLAFDLAYLVHLPVAPVVLWRDQAPDIYKRGRSISAWTFEQSLKWDEAQNRGLITPVLRESAGPIVSAMRVFHTWIADKNPITLRSMLTVQRSRLRRRSSITEIRSHLCGSPPIIRHRHKHLTCLRRSIVT